jgi:hypothetical protein
MSEPIVCKIIDWLSGDECHELDLAGLTAGFGVRMARCRNPPRSDGAPSAHPPSANSGQDLRMGADEPVEFLDLQHGTSASAALRNPLYHVVTAREWLSLRLDDPAANGPRLMPSVNESLPSF